MTDVRKVTPRTLKNEFSIINAFILGLTTPEVLTELGNKKTEKELKFFIDIVAKFGLTLPEENQWEFVKSFLLKKRESDPLGLQSFLSRHLFQLAKKLIIDDPKNLEQHREATFSEFLAEFENYANFQKAMYRRYQGNGWRVIEPARFILNPAVCKPIIDPTTKEETAEYFPQTTDEVFNECKKAFNEILVSTHCESKDPTEYKAKLQSEETKKKLKDIWVNKGHQILLESLIKDNAVTENEIIPLVNLFGIHVNLIEDGQLKSLNSQVCIPLAEAKLDQRSPEINLAYVVDPPYATFWEYVPTLEAHAAALKEISKADAGDQKSEPPKSGFRK